ncbi:circadian clock-controlled protein daywake-like [Battus philenor]|uniref:circadian clock-controlled protein daywake-like n=1 Tax=Battus philenor TaxID=42288 RepID=UPI0035CF7C63
MKFLALCVFVCFYTQSGYARRITNTTETVNADPLKINQTMMCHYSDPDIANCIKIMAEQARGVLAHGIPSLNIQPLEPLKIPNIRLRQHNAPKSGFKYDAWFSDVELRGLTNYTFNKLDVYPEELRVNTNISLPHLTMSGEYVVIGQFQMLPVESTGKMAANFTLCTAALEAIGAKVHKRIVVRDAIVKLKCSGRLSADLMEAHSTTSEMEMITNHVVTMHSSEIAKEVQPAVETALAMVLEDIANKFLKRIPSNMVFPN